MMEEHFYYWRCPYCKLRGSGQHTGEANRELIKHIVENHLEEAFEFVVSLNPCQIKTSVVKLNQNYFTKPGVWYNPDGFEPVKEEQL